MKEASRSIAIFSLGQVIAVAREKIREPEAFETIERHVKQVVAVLMDKPYDRIDGQCDSIVSQVEALLYPDRQSLNRGNDETKS
jgi:hypothetical protein